MPVKWNKQHTCDSLLLAATLCCGTGLLLFSRPVSAAVAQALELCITVLLPSLYPFFVLSALLISSGLVQRLSPKLDKPMRKLFGLPGSCAAAVLLGAIGGYPVGARTVASLYMQGHCSKTDGIAALRFCNNAGPAFLISAIGSGLLHDPRLGLQLYGIHLLCALLIGLLCHRKHEAVKSLNYTSSPVQKHTDFGMILHSVTGSFATFLNVSAFVLIFAVLMCLLEQTPLLDLSTPLWSGLCSGILELTSGAMRLSQAGLSQKALLPAMSFLCGWGGLSVQMQTISLLQEAGLPCRGYLKAKLLHGLVAAMLTYLLCC